jgi:hypothetical protein
MINTKSIPVLLLMLVLAACNGKTEAKLEDIRANGKVKVTVTGSRPTSIEAWKVDLSVKAYNFKEGKLTFEIYADDLNSESVNFKWLDETNCHIIFTQRDNTVRTFQLVASPDQLQLAEI